MRIVPLLASAALILAPPPATKEEYFARFAKTWKVLRVGSFPEDEALDPARAARTYERGLNPAGVGRQLRAVLASGSRKERLSQVRVPTLVIHRTGDQCLKIEEGRYLAEHIPGATLVELPGNDHLPFVGDQVEMLAAIDQFLAKVPRVP